MSARQAAFDSRARLRTPREFRRVFAEGERVVAAGMVVIAAPGGHDTARLGLAIAKRRVRRAVDRNRIKRVLRESFRHVRAALPSADVVVLARERAGAMSNAQLFAALAPVWSRMAEDDTLAAGARRADTIG